MSDFVVWGMLAAAIGFVLLSFFILGRLAKHSRDTVSEVREELRLARSETHTHAKELREEVLRSMQTTSEALVSEIERTGKNQYQQLESMNRQLKELSDSNQQQLDKIRITMDARARELQEGNEKKLEAVRKENTDAFKMTSETLTATLDRLNQGQQKQLEGMTAQLKEFTTANQNGLDRIRVTFDERVRELQAGNEKKLDEMRKTVDEKLHDTLEKRLGESFKIVSERLERVHKGLGEMQNLATGVGDLKRVLSNVKARGTWAEVQLGAILDQMLTSSQFERNVCVRENSSERVEFAIRLPGSKNEPDSHVWLPIDSKFPQEDYLRLQEAADKGDPEAVQSAADALARTIRASAKEIHDKYVNPPATTDFGIMFLATEGLYAEVLRQADLVEDIQQQYRVVLAGPTTLAAIVSSLRMGFQTLAIEQRASEVWRVLGAVKTEFTKFGTVLTKVKKQLDTASKSIDATDRRKRAMEKKLLSVEQLQDTEASELFGLPGVDVETNAEDSLKNGT